MKTNLYRLLAWMGLGFALSLSSLQATHQMGLDITYECLTSCQYRVYVTTYYDCTGAATSPYLPVSAGNPPPNPSADFNVSDWSINGQGPGCTPPTSLGGWVLDPDYGYIEVTPVCPTVQTSCSGGGGGAVNGVVAVRYYRDYDFCNVNCNTYNIVYEGCCRNGSITSLSGAGGNGMFSGVTTINTSLANCNSSPVFTNPPVPYLCAGQSFTFNQGASDPDGDSLVYSLGDCFRDPGVIVSYNGGYNAAQPLGPTWNFTVNSSTGDITLTPNPLGTVQVGVICIYITEYRNGVQIGQVVRDMQITVINCGSGNVLPTLSTPTGGVSPLTNISNPNSSANGLTLTTCACQEVCFDIPVTDPNQNDNTYIFFNNPIAGSSISDASNPGVPVDTVFGSGPGNPPTAQFCWVPDSAGTYTFLATLRDDGCPIIGQNQYTITVNVISCTLDPTASITRQGCYDVQFRGIPCGGNDPFQFTWFGDAGFGGSGEFITHTYPGPGTYAYTLTVTDSSGVASTITDSLTLNNTAAADAGPNITVCSGNVGTIGTPALPGYTYQWSSPNGTGWNGPANPSVAEPQVTFANQTSGPIELEYYLEATDPIGCVGRDTVRVTFEPTTSSVFVVDPQPEVCVDDTLTLTYASAPPPGAFYLWNLDGGIGSTNGPGPHRVTWATPGVKQVSLAVFTAGCPSDTFTVPITVNPIPSSSFLLPDTVCEDAFNQVIYNGSASLNATYTWDVGNATPPNVTGSGPHNLSWSTQGFQQVSLTVEENGCESTPTTRTTLVRPTPDNSFSVDDSICAGELMQITYTGTNGPNAAYSWNFGNGVIVSGSGAGPYQVFWPTPGTRSVCLQVSEGDCSSPVRCQNVVVKGRPIIQIDPVDDQCYPGNAFTFNVVGGPADVYNWNFGNSAVPATFQGTPSNPLPSQPVRYLSPGTKTVTLTIADDGCQGPDTATVTFDVVPEPSADFQASTNQICGGGPIGFTYLGSDPDNSQTYVWSFGPGAVPSSSTLKNPTIAYNTPGAKQVTLTVFDGPCQVSSTQTIEVKPGPTVSAGPDTAFCEGEGGVELQASTFGGTPPYFYTWTCDRAPNCGITPTNVEDPLVNPVPLSPGTETVTYAYFVTDVNGCRSNTDSVTVTIKAKPKVNAGDDIALCAPADSGAFLQATPAVDNQAPGDFSYQWIPAAGLNTDDSDRVYARPDSTTIYTVIATSPNGCTSESNTVDPLSTVTVTVNDKPQANAGPDVELCFGESVELEGFASGAGPNYVYNWTASPGGSLDDSTLATPIATPTQTTEYTLQVRTGACWSDGDKVLVTVHPRPTLTTLPEASACLFEAYQLSASASNANGPFTYNWTPGSSLSDSTIRNPLATPEATTTYSVSAASAEGCVSDTSFMTLDIRPTPVVDLMAQDTTVCGDDPLTLTASHSFRTLTPPSGRVNYNWSPGDFTFETVNGADSVVAVTPLRSGYVVVEAVIASGACPTRDSIFLTVEPAIDALARADTTRICAGSSTVLYAEGGRGNSTYRWEPATGLDDPTLATPLASPDSTTTYVLAISEGVCTSYDTLTVAVNPSPGADYFNSIATGCGGLEVTFMENAPGAIAYRWDFGDSSELSNEANPIHVYEAPGQYVVQFTAIGEGGCEETVSRQVVEVFEAVEAAFSSVPPSGERIAVGTPIQFEDQSAEAATWVWDFGDGASSTAQDPVHRYETPGQYEVSLTVTDSAGCSSTTVVGVYDIFIPEVERQTVFTPNGDRANDVFQINYPNPARYQLTVFDRWGRIVFEADSPDMSWDGTLPNGSRARDGVYLYTVLINDTQFTGSVTLLR